MTDSHKRLLSPGEPPVFTLLNADASSPLVLVCDHASNRIPQTFNNLGLNNEDLNSHIAWDPGAVLVAKSLSAQLDTALVLSNYSRLVIDCNRPMKSPELISEQSAGVVIPGNQSLTANDRELRIQTFFTPYHQAIDQLLSQRSGPSVLLSIHTFTPELDGIKRPWQIGVASTIDQRFGRALYAGLQQFKELNIGFNQPYEIESEFDYTIPIHGQARGLLSAMIEIRQDGVCSALEAESWATRLASVWRSSSVAALLASS